MNRVTHPEKQKNCDQIATNCQRRLNMKWSLLLILMLILIAPWPCCLGAYFKFTNVECKILDPKFVEFKECYLKLVRRNVVGMNFHLGVKTDRPIDKIEFNLCIYRKSNVYRLFMVNHTLDFCYYMKKPQQYPLFYIFHDSLMSATNANHTCPYQEKDIYLRKMTLSEQAVRDLQLPNGEYKLTVTVGAFKVWRLQVNLYGVRG